MDEMKKIATINKVDIMVMQNGDKMVPVTPICEALGIASNNQIEKIKSDPILNSVGMIIISTGKDGKQYKMFSIPFKYTFGWLFTIDSRKVSEEARPLVIKYQLECYDALYDYFTAYADYVEYKNQYVKIFVEKEKLIRSEFNATKKTLGEAGKELDSALEFSFDAYKQMKAQKKLFTEAEMEG
jgi:hypothetical protein